MTNENEYFECNNLDELYCSMYNNTLPFIGLKKDFQKYLIDVNDPGINDNKIVVL